jgi:hypothetical protein
MDALTHHRDDVGTEGWTAVTSVNWKSRLDWCSELAGMHRCQCLDVGEQHASSSICRPHFYCTVVQRHTYLITNKFLYCCHKNATEVAGMAVFLDPIYTKFRMPNSGSSLFFTVKGKAKYKFPAMCIAIAD